MGDTRYNLFHYPKSSHREERKWLYFSVVTEKRMDQKGRWGVHIRE